MIVVGSDRVEMDGCLIFSLLCVESSETACLEDDNVSHLYVLSSLLLLENNNASNIELLELKGDSSEESVGLMKDPLRRIFFAGTA